MACLGLDIGGANLKASTSDGRAAAMSFPLWKSPELLTEALSKLVEPLDDYSHIGVTMTGELADCFPTKAEGVARILDSVRQFAGQTPVAVWSTLGQPLSLDEAKSNWQAVAAANWHALATWAGRFVPEGLAILIDIGSTTTDIIPIRDGVPIPEGRTDLERLLSSELVYTGVRRTPVCAVASVVDVRGGMCPLAAELFATMRDVHLLNGDMAPAETDLDTADGRPATITHAENRLAHMLCCDRTELTTAELREIAAQIAQEQMVQIQLAVQKVFETCWDELELATPIVSGSGAFLARKVVESMMEFDEPAMIDLSTKLSPALSEAACAYAVAQLM